MFLPLFYNITRIHRKEIKSYWALHRIQKLDTTNIKFQNYRSSGVHTGENNEFIMYKDFPTHLASRPEVS